MPRGLGRLGWLGLWLCTSTTACDGCGSTDMATVASGSPDPVPVASSSWRDSPLASAPAWQAPPTDPLDRTRFAQTEGAHRLLEGLAAGGPLRQTALEALPYAPDAFVALGPLSALAVEGTEAERVASLEALIHILSRRRTQREALDPEGGLVAAERLTKLAEDADAPPAVRRLALAAVGRLAEHGFASSTPRPTPE